MAQSDYTTEPYTDPAVGARQAVALRRQPVHLAPGATVILAENDSDDSRIRMWIPKKWQSMAVNGSQRGMAVSPRSHRVAGLAGGVGDEGPVHEFAGRPAVLALRAVDAGQRLVLGGGRAVLPKRAARAVRRVDAGRAERLQAGLRRVPGSPQVGGVRGSKRVKRGGKHKLFFKI